MMQQVLIFQKQVNEKNEVNENMLEKTFTAIYWLAKEVIVGKTEFLVTKCIDDPRGANAEVITDHTCILDTLKECDLEVRNLKSFVSDGASVMTG